MLIDNKTANGLGFKKSIFQTNILDFSKNFHLKVKEINQNKRLSISVFEPNMKSIFQLLNDHPCLGLNCYWHSLLLKDIWTGGT